MAISPAVTYICEAGDNFAATFISESVRQQLGYEPEAFVRDPDFWVNHIHPDDVSRVLGDLDSLFEKGRHSHEYRFLHQDGSYRWMYDELTLVRDSRGKPERLIGAWIDITESKRARIALGESEERFRSLVEGSIQGIIVTRRFKVLFVNQAMADIFNFDSQAELLELDSILPHIAPEDRKRVTGFTEARLRGEPSPPVYEYQAIRKDGVRIWLEVRVSLINWIGGPASLSTVVDISDRKQAELKLRESEERFRDFAEIGADWLWETDSEHCFTYISSGYEKTTGKNPREFLGKARREISRKTFLNDPEHWEAHKRDLDARRSFDDFKFRHKAKNGSIRTLSISGRPLYDNDGRFTGYRGVTRDITRVIEAENAARNAALIAERANAAKSRFLATASHDLRQPLQSLSLLNETLLRTVDSANAQRLLGMQKEALSGMRNLLNSLLDITRLESGNVAPQVTDVPLQGIFDTVVANFGEQATAKGLDLQVERTDATARTDPNLAAQAIQNLVANAIRYTEKGFVRLACAHDAGGLKVTVTDSGVGIPKDQFANIFAEFHQLGRDPQARNAGLGLGLAIVQRIAEMLDIPVDVESEVGEGSSFSLMLPAGIATPVEAVPPAETAESSMTGTGTVLLIDDEVAVLEASRMLLEVEGYEVIAVASASAAYARLEELANAPDVIVTDFHLGNSETGIDIVQTVRKRANKQIPAILITGDTSPLIDEFKKEYNEILIKPVEPDQLLSAIRSLLRQEVALTP